MSEQLPVPTVEPTQVTYPARATYRTIFQVIVAIGFAAPGIWLAIEAAFNQNGTAIPGWLTGAGAMALLAGSITARIMAIPGVNDWLLNLPVLPLAAIPKPLDSVPSSVVNEADTRDAEGNPVDPVAQHLDDEELDEDR